MLPSILLFYLSFSAPLTVWAKQCWEGCNLALVETALTLDYPDYSLYNDIDFRDDSSRWLTLIRHAEKKIEIASYFWDMNEPSEILNGTTKARGTMIFDELKKAIVEKGLQVELVHKVNEENNTDTDQLVQLPNVTVYKVNPKDITGGGAFRSNFWVVDRTNFYLGSANTDWRSFNANKELGISGFNCPDLAEDLGKIFDIYRSIGKTGKKPAEFILPKPTEFNVNNSMTVDVVDCNKYKTFISSSPPALTPQGRTKSIDALLYCIEKAEKYIYIAVTDYSPLMFFTEKVQYWPVLENALKKAAIDRNIKIRLLISKHDELYFFANRMYKHFIKSLQDIAREDEIDIKIKWFVMRYHDEPINEGLYHSKFMVTDKTAYIGTSDFVGDYFELNPGVGIVLEDADSNNKNSIRDQLEALFRRDWESRLASELIYKNEDLKFIPDL